MNTAEIENIELKLLIEAINTRYEYDFSDYAQASFKRRVKNFMVKKGLSSISQIIPLVLHDKNYFFDFIYSLSVTVTEMFRDPFVYKAIRKHVIPYLKTFPFLKIWHAGCATGEEVYAMAILLAEEGLLARTQIYATDFNDLSLTTAKNGIYSLEQIKSYTDNYNKAGGTASFSDYFHAQYDSAIMDSELKKNIVFTNHNLAIDSSFGEMHFIVCRNVLIYFNRNLQDRVLCLFVESLHDKGFICLGTKESLFYSSVQNKFNTVAENEKIFQLK